MFRFVYEQVKSNPLSQAYKKLDGRDRTLINLVAITTLLVGYYYLLYLPLDNFQKSAVTQFQSEQRGFAWMKTNEAKARAQLKHKLQQPNHEESTLALIASTANDFGVSIARFQPDPNGVGVSLVIQQQSFDGIIHWTKLLSSRHNLQVIQASINSSIGSHLVDARLMIR